MKKSRIIFTALFASTAMILAACGNTPPKHVHKYVEHAEVAATCHSEGTEFYYTCEGCDKYFDSQMNVIENPVVIPVDPNNHTSSPKIVAGGSFKTAYRVGDKFDITGLTLTLKCDDCEGRVLTSSQMERVSISYPTESESSFVAGDLAKETLQVTLTYNSFSTKVNVTLSKKTNAIVGLTALEGHCGYKPFTELEGVSSILGTVTYYFAETEDGEYKTAEQLGDDYIFINKQDSHDSSTTYYVKAVVTEGEDYEGATATTTLTITHNDTEWDTSRDDYDFYGCVCKEPTTFNKVVSLANQDLDLSEDTHSLSLEGTSYDSETDTIKSIKIGEFDLGTDLSNITIPSGLLNDVTLHGANEIEVVVSTPEEGNIPECDHTIKVPVTLVTKMLKTKDDVESIRPRNTLEDTFGYYKVANDIDISTIKEGYWQNTSEIGFKGVFDGDNHILTTKSTGYGLFYVINDATIKNLTFNNIWDKRGFASYTSPLCVDLVNTTVENVTFKYSAKSSDTAVQPAAGQGITSCRKCIDVNFKNCEFNYDGQDIGVLNGYGPNFARISYENCTLTAKSYTLVYYSSYENMYHYAMEGLTINSVVNTSTYMVAQSIYVNHDGAQSVSLEGTNFATKTVESVKLGDYDLGNDLANLQLSEDFKNDVSIRGPQLLTIGFADYSIVIPVNVVLEQIDLDIDPQDLIFDKTNSVSLSGTDYEGATVISMVLYSYDLGNDTSAITLPSELQSDVSKHGETTLNMKVSKDSKTYNIGLPVFVVTEEITTAGQLEKLSTISGQKVYGYYIIGADFNHSQTSTPSYDWNGAGNGFYGTLDGRGHTITFPNSTFGSGIFGTTCDGAVIKNLKIDHKWYNGGWNSQIFGYTMYGTTVDNVTIIITAGSYNEGNIQNGLIVNETGGCTFKNITITSASTKLCSMVRTNVNKSGALSTFENCVVTAPTINAIIGSTNDRTTAGWTINETAA